MRRSEPFDTTEYRLITGTVGGTPAEIKNALTLQKELASRERKG
jgi:hypothetical protein